MPVRDGTKLEVEEEGRPTTDRRSRRTAGEQADRPFASGSFGTTAQEQEEGETLEQQLGEERSSKLPSIANSPSN